MIHNLTQKIRSFDKPVGILAGSQTDAKVYRDWGIRFIGVGSDQAFIKRGAGSVLSELRQL
jgi:2-keto-3-deoxy-L-rhamnonate aldolase RhmA